MSSPLNRVQPNVQPEVLAGGKDLEALQKERVIVVRSSDKTGGVSVRAVDGGMEKGFISKGDAKLMVPEQPTPARLYGLVKDHKAEPEGSNIPPLREVMSGSGSNTEYISALVDHYAKPGVQQLPSLLEDTPDVLRKIATKNREGPLPPGDIPVVMDASALPLSTTSRGFV